MLSFRGVYRLYHHHQDCHYRVSGTTISSHMFLKKSHHHRHRHRHHRGYHYYALGCCYCVFARSSMNNVLLLIRLIDIEMSFYDPTLETGIRTRHYAEFDDGGGKYNLLVSYFFYDSDDSAVSHTSLDWSCCC
jgi:hypothetical protein